MEACAPPSPGEPDESAPTTLPAPAAAAPRATVTSFSFEDGPPAGTNNNMKSDIHTYPRALISGTSTGTAVDGSYCCKYR